MSNVDKRGKLNEDIFDYRLTKDGRVMLYWQDKHIKTLAGKEAQRFIEKIDGLDDHDAQLLMAKATGNFKRGNERTASDQNA
jgi:hypothetical protein